MAERHVGRGLLVPRVDDADAVGVAGQGVEQPVHLHAGQAEHGVDPVAKQAVDDRIATGHARHGESLLTDAPAIDHLTAHPPSGGIDEPGGDVASKVIRHGLAN